MAAHGVTPSDVSNAIVANNYQSAGGSTQGNLMTVSIRSTTDLNTVQQFKNIVVRNVNGKLVHLSDVAKVELGQASYQSYATLSITSQTFMGIEGTPNSNPLTVVAGVNKLLKKITPTLPPGLNQTIVYNASTFIDDSIKEVISTILEAAIIVILVIYLSWAPFVV